MARTRPTAHTPPMPAEQGAERLARELPRETRRLLAEHVHSVGELELLMLLDGDRTREWRVEEICDALRCPRSWAERRLSAMAGAGLLVAEQGRYKCAPASRELDHALRALERAHRTQRADLLTVIVSPRRRRHAFADVLAGPRDRRG
jgi:hypothetical protein